MTDEFDGIFDNLNPSDFHFTSTALHERVIDFYDSPFERFVDHNLTAVRYAWAAADGAINTVATLSDGTIERMFNADDDDTVRSYTLRLQREAQAMRARWVFVSVRTRVGTLLVGQIDGEDVSVDSRSNVDLTKSMGTNTDAVYWYAARTDDPEQRRHGFIMIDDNRLGTCVRGEVDQPVKFYDRILNITD